MQKRNKTVTILSVSEHGLVATNATEVPEWIKVGDNSFVATGRMIKLPPTHTLDELVGRKETPDA